MLCRVSRKKVVNSPVALQEEQTTSREVLNTLYSVANTTYRD